MYWLQKGNICSSAEKIYNIIDNVNNKQLPTNIFNKEP